jgi:hypothetical protein
MRERLTIVVAPLLAVALISGCYTFGISETARTTPQGGFQFTGTLTPYHLSVAPEGGAAQVLFVFPELKAKFGLADRVDMGIYWAFGPGLGLNVKTQFAEGPVDAAVLLGGSLYGLGIADAFFGIYDVSPRVIVSSERAGSFPFCLNAGVKYLGIAAGAEGETATGGVLSCVGGVGLPFRFGNTRSIRLMPEVSLSIPVLSTYMAGGEGETDFLYEGFTASLGFCIGYVGADEESGGGAGLP